MAKATFYRKVFRDICRGYSEFNIQGSPAFIKHVNNQEQVDLDDLHEEEYEKWRKKGLPTRKEKTKELIKTGEWTEEEEKWLSSQEAYIKSMHDSKRHIILKSQIDKQNIQIEKAEKELREKIAKKEGMLINTCDSFADRRLNDFYVLSTLYKDKDLKEKYFPTKDSFFDLDEDDEEYRELIKRYNEFIELCSEFNIQSVILQDFYYSYFPFCEDTVGFFGRSVTELTHYQLKLIIFTRVFKNILENGQHIPEKIKKDPQALLEYGSMSPETKQRIQDQIEGKGSASLVGGTKEDYEYLGLTPPSESGINLQDKVKEAGGTMGMQELMKLHGINTK